MQKTCYKCIKRDVCEYQKMIKKVYKLIVDLPFGINFVSTEPFIELMKIIGTYCKYYKE